MGFINTVKNFIGIETEEDYYDEDYYEEDDDIEEEPPARRSSSKRGSSKVIPINPGVSSKIRIMKPAEFDDSTGIADEIKGGRLVIFDVGNLDAGEARRVVDFVSGAAYGVNGNVRRVSGGIFVAAPRNIDITGDNLKEHTRNTFDWNV
ncbi:MAG: cell division protein SepF [Oscillospiraceae bacterium]|nr:cell division protein SepF [Oscillospiraceae bacterium]